MNHCANGKPKGPLTLNPGQGPGLRVPYLKIENREAFNRRATQIQYIQKIICENRRGLRLRIRFFRPMSRPDNPTLSEFAVDSTAVFQSVTL